MSAKRIALVCALLLAAHGQSLAGEESAEYVVRASSEWIPVTPCVAPAAGSALDFSGLGFTDGPCGKHGRIVARGLHFEYERKPGVAQRFYGVNLCAGCTTLPKDESRKLVENFVRIGYNALRIHHHENSLLKPEGDRMTFDSGALDRFDALIAECRSRGIYVTTDLFVSRTIPKRACGIDEDGNLEEAKVLVLFHPGVHSNYLAFAKGLLSHRNPYTGLTYAEDPTLAWISLINEGNLPNFGTHLLKTYAAFVKPYWQKWLTRRRATDVRYAEIPEALPDVLSEEAARTNRHVAAFQHFLADREARFAQKMRRWLREDLGCKALVTDMNCWTFPATLQSVRAENYDYVGLVTEALAVQGHTYVRPALYETTLQGKLARDKESQDMLDLIFDTMSVDFGWIHTGNKGLGWMVNACLSGKHENISSFYEKFEGHAVKYYDDIINYYREID